MPKKQQPLQPSERLNLLLTIINDQTVLLDNVAFCLEIITTLEVGSFSRQALKQLLLACANYSSDHDSDIMKMMVALSARLQQGSALYNFPENEALEVLVAHSRHVHLWNDKLYCYHSLVSRLDVNAFTMLILQQYDKSTPQAQTHLRILLDTLLNDDAKRKCLRGSTVSALLSFFCTQGSEYTRPISMVIEQLQGDTPELFFTEFLNTVSLPHFLTLCHHKPKLPLVKKLKQIIVSYSSHQHPQPLLVLLTQKISTLTQKKLFGDFIVLLHSTLQTKPLTTSSNNSSVLNSETALQTAGQVFNELSQHTGNHRLIIKALSMLEKMISKSPEHFLNASPVTDSSLEKSSTLLMLMSKVKSLKLVLANKLLTSLYQGSDAETLQRLINCRAPLRHTLIGLDTAYWKACFSRHSFGKDSDSITLLCELLILTNDLPELQAPLLTLLKKSYQHAMPKQLNHLVIKTGSRKILDIIIDFYDNASTMHSLVLNKHDNSLTAFEMVAQINHPEITKKICRYITLPELTSKLCQVSQFNTTVFCYAFYELSRQYLKEKQANQVLTELVRLQKHFPGNSDLYQAIFHKTPSIENPLYTVSRTWPANGKLCTLAITTFDSESDMNKKLSHFSDSNWVKPTKEKCSPLFAVLLHLSKQAKEINHGGIIAPKGVLTGLCFTIIALKAALRISASVFTRELARLKQRIPSHPKFKLWLYFSLKYLLRYCERLSAEGHQGEISAALLQVQIKTLKEELHTLQGGPLEKLNFLDKIFEEQQRKELKNDSINGLLRFTLPFILSVIQTTHLIKLIQTYPDIKPEIVGSILNALLPKREKTGPLISLFTTLSNDNPLKTLIGDYLFQYYHGQFSVLRLKLSHEAFRDLCQLVQHIPDSRTKQPYLHAMNAEELLRYCRVLYSVTVLFPELTAPHPEEQYIPVAWYTVMMSAHKLLQDCELLEKKNGILIFSHYQRSLSLENKTIASYTLPNRVLNSIQSLLQTQIDHDNEQLERIGVVSRPHSRQSSYFQMDPADSRRSPESRSGSTSESLTEEQRLPLSHNRRRERDPRLIRSANNTPLPRGCL